MEKGPLIRLEFSPACEAQACSGQLVFVSSSTTDFQLVLAEGRVLALMAYPAGGFVTPV